MGRILIIGAGGQLGTVLTNQLKEWYGEDQVIASDLRNNGSFTGHFELIDATDYQRIEEVVQQYQVEEIYHLAAILSANGEKNPLGTWDMNMKTLFNVLEVSRLNGVKKVFYPSSIAVFGSEVVKQNTPQASFLNPSTVYGMSKAAGENWAQYYFQKYGLDVRSLRYPGVIGYQSLPGGGTTDYAVDIFHRAVEGTHYTCFLEADTTLPMIYMEDAIRATIALMQAPAESIKTRMSYNLAGMSFSPKEIAAVIQKTYPDFTISYAPDFRQQIASSWPQSIDDSPARSDWGWKPMYDLESMAADMIKQLKKEYILFE
ncbi:NAD-dependent epimerase/dehydratase family protein [Reichenbachiella carrageenanivorans]|uniref:NAD-dependent epimerase/dehydratase family protein n=1 Tax=Reichenbachiella carrageenanivorans TaxID=2979869 RepID=A0ABY6D3B1_9BACT|nr:NAD-dependent epimerase/dehydratase family protein [Reichenbachiella carrageenanivorans]UXX80115.1 NAD-dependent epimerase/dehydratase family protein [Reichenbachiella carrageenanivorans]